MLGNVGTTVGVTTGALVVTVTAGTVVVATMTAVVVAVITGDVVATTMTGGTMMITGVLHTGDVMEEVSVVTVPPKASADPDQIVFAPMVMPALSSTFPRKVVFAPSVVAPNGVQKTSHADDPEMLAPAAVVSAPDGLKIYVPLPFKVRGPLTFIAPVLQ